MPRLLPVALLLGACTEEMPDVPEGETEFAQEFEDAQSLGDFAVGYRQVDVTYRPATSDEDRTIPVEVWYPAEAGGEAAQYAVGGLIEIDSPVATTAAPTTPADGTFPVALYSHGNGGVGLVGYPIGEYLASQGWIVLAPDHVGNTALELLTGGGDPFIKSVIERPQDVSASLDWIETVADDPLSGLGDTSSVLLVGHSFGGYTIFAAAGAQVSADRLDPGCPDPDNPNCPLFEDPDVQALLTSGFGDDRVAALVPQAPAIRSFAPEALTALELPTMLQSGGLDITTTPETSAIPTWDAIDGEDDVWVDMPEGGHITFLSICDDLEEAQVGVQYGQGLGGGNEALAAAVVERARLEGRDELVFE
ncbi:MAG: hypothetical protein AAF211_27690, partial [Myxococcota bacterium]